MNYLWGGMLLIGIIYGLAAGNLEAVTEAAVSSSKEAVSLCVVMAGVMGLWVGIMRIAENAGLIAQLTGKIRPVIRWLFPRIPQDHPACQYIATNFIANILGLGWAATPAGITAMEHLAELNREERSRTGRSPSIASREMCTFLILNISSLQLIPMTVVAYRTEYGSTAPAAVVGPAILATLVSTGAGVIFCRIMDRKRRGR